MSHSEDVSELWSCERLESDNLEDRLEEVAGDADPCHVSRSCRCRMHGEYACGAGDAAGAEVVGGAGGV